MFIVKQVLGGIGDGKGAASPLKSVRDRKSISRQSLAANPGTSLALKYEKLTVHSFERMVRANGQMCLPSASPILKTAASP